MIKPEGEKMKPRNIVLSLAAVPIFVAGLVAGDNYQTWKLSKSVDRVAELERRLREFHVNSPNSDDYWIHPTGKFIRSDPWGDREVSQETYIQAREYAKEINWRNSK